jgi:hypothetical protein
VLLEDSGADPASVRVDETDDVGLRGCFGHHASTVL